MFVYVDYRPVANLTFMDAEICFYEASDSADAWLRVPYRFDAADTAVSDEKIMANATGAVGSVSSMYTRLIALRVEMATLAALGRHAHGSLWREVAYSDLPDIAGGAVTQAWYEDDAAEEPWHSEAKTVSMTDARLTIERVVADLDERSLVISQVYDRGRSIATALGIPLGIRFEMGAS
jgi:hypothetical protein